MPRNRCFGVMLDLQDNFVKSHFEMRHVNLFKRTVTNSLKIKTNVCRQMQFRFKVVADS